MRSLTNAAGLPVLHPTGRGYSVIRFVSDPGAAPSPEVGDHQLLDEATGPYFR